MSSLGPPPIILPNKGTILDVVVQKCRSESKTGLLHDTLEETVRYLVVCGSDNVGKTSLIAMFMEVPEDLVPTVILDYSCGVKNTREDEPGLDVCHVWELSSGPIFIPLLKTVDVGSELSIVLMLDLSQPTKLWFTMQAVLKNMREYINSRKDSKELKKKSYDYVSGDHSDKAYFKPYAAPLIIIGGKYDLFKMFEPEKKRILCICLRYIAHICCAHIFFYSGYDTDLSKYAKSYLDQYGYGIKPTSVKVVKDYNKALRIPPGEDSLEEIKGSSQLKLDSLEDCRNLLSTYFPQVDPWSHYGKDDPKNDPNFREPRIDELRKEKDKELENILKQLSEQGK